MLFVHVDEHIKLYTAINVDLFGLSVSHNFGLEGAVLDFGQDAFASSEHTIIVHSEMLGPFQDVIQVKVDHVITRDEIWIVGDDKFLKVQ